MSNYSGYLFLSKDSNHLGMVSDLIQNRDLEHPLWLKPSGALWGSWARRPFLSRVSCRQDSSLHGLPWVPKGRFEQLLIKGGTAKKPPEARLKGPEKLIKIRRLTTWGPAHTLILSATPPLNRCHKTPHQTPLGWDTVFEGRSPLCPPLPRKARKLFYSTSPKTLSPRFDSALVYREAELSA